MDWKIPATVIILILLFVAIIRSDFTTGKESIIGKILDKVKNVVNTLISYTTKEKTENSNNEKISFFLNITGNVSRLFILKNSDVILDQEETKIHGFSGGVQINHKLQISGSYKRLFTNGMLISTPGKIEEADTNFKTIYISSLFSDSILFTHATGTIKINNLEAALEQSDVEIKNTHFSLFYDKARLLLNGTADTIKVDEVEF